MFSVQSCAIMILRLYHIQFATPARNPFAHRTFDMDSTKLLYEFMQIQVQEFVPHNPDQNLPPQLDQSRTGTDSASDSWLVHSFRDLGFLSAIVVC